MRARATLRVRHRHNEARRSTGGRRAREEGGCAGAGARALAGARLAVGAPHGRALRPAPGPRNAGTARHEVTTTAKNINGGLFRTYVYPAPYPEGNRSTRIR